jgi:hypothetical protein
MCVCLDLARLLPAPPATLTHVAASPRVPRAVDFAHPARTEGRNNFIRPEFYARWEWHTEARDYTLVNIDLRLKSRLTGP